MSVAEIVAPPCPDDESFARLIEGTLAPDRVRDLQEHCDGCAHCARALAELARTLAPDAWLGGRYQLLEPLGAGGMGVVFAALDTKLRRKVAVKRLRDADSDSTADLRRARFLREAQLLASLSHPNVLTVHDVGEIEREIYVVTELIDGWPMSRWVSQGPARPEHQKIVDLYLQAGRGLSAAHQLNVVHRDVKPENILVARSGRVLIGDFGLAGLTGSAEAAPGKPSIAAGLTQTGAVLGTPAYMAPELRGGRPGDALSDQFAFCMSLYESLHGRRAFSGDTDDELVAAIRTARIVPGADGVPGAIDRVLAVGLAAEPRRRYPSMDALLSDLARARDRPPRRRWMALAASAMLVGGLTGVALLRHERPRPASRAVAAARASDSELPPRAPSAEKDPAIAAPTTAAAAGALDPTRAVLALRGPATAIASPRHRHAPPRVVAALAAPPSALAPPGTPAPPGALAPTHSESDPLLLLYLADIARGDHDGVACLAALDSLPSGAWPAALVDHAQRRRATCEMLRGNCRKGVRLLEPLDGADGARAAQLASCPAGSFASVEDRILAVTTQADDERYAGNQSARRQTLRRTLLRQAESAEIQACLRDRTASRACDRRLTLLARAYQVLAESFLIAGDCAEGAELDVAHSDVNLHGLALDGGDPDLRCRAQRTFDVYKSCAPAGEEAERRCLARLHAPEPAPAPTR